MSKLEYALWQENWLRIAELEAQVAALTIERNNHRSDAWALSDQIAARDAIILWYLDQPPEADGVEAWKAWFARQPANYVQALSEIKLIQEED